MKWCEQHPLFVWLLRCASVASVAGCGGGGDDSVTFRDDVSPAFQNRCTICHETGNVMGVNIENPFDSVDGLVFSRNTRNAEDPSVALERNVLPGEPESSYLLNKLEGRLPEDGSAGAPMPLQVEPLTQQEIATVEQWVLDGAVDGAFYREEVQPIFGYRERGQRAKCVFCHYPGTPNPPDLTDPFGPEGLFQRALFRPDYDRVAPGDPDNSFLILKIRATEVQDGLGAPMPYSYDPLSPSEIDVVRRWIAEGALN